MTYTRIVPISSFVLAAAVVIACDDSAQPVEPTGPRAVVCEPRATATSELAVDRLSELSARGGHVARLIVDRETPRINGVVFRRITDAIAEARRIRQSATVIGEGCRITIQVSPGTYVGTTGTPTDSTVEQLPLVMNMSRVSLIGAYEIPASGGRAMGPSTSARVSVLTASPALAIAGGTTNATRYSEPILIVDADGSSGGNGVRIEGFVFRSGHTASTPTGGVGVLSLRATGLEVVGNSFEGNFTERVDVRSGGALIERNFSNGPGGTCDICINGPGTEFVVRGNTAVDGGIPGVLVMPAIILPLPPGFVQVAPPAISNTTVLIDNNDVSGHQSVPVGTGFRVTAMGNGAPDTQGNMQITFTRNRASNNRFGLIVEAGFPVTGGALRGNISLTTSGNTFLNSCQTDLLVSLSRHTTGLGLATLPYLRNSTYTLALGADLPFTAAWYAHPTGLGNTLVVGGAEVSPGTRIAYDATKVCN